MASNYDNGYYRQQINQTVDASLESTRRIRMMAEETQDVAVKTNAELDHQGEKLRNIETQLDDINEDMKQTEKTLIQMDKFLGLFRMPKFGKKKDKFKQNDALWDKSKRDETDSVSSHSSASTASSLAPRAKPMPSGRIIHKIADDAREDEMEENMQAVDGILANLKNMALDMGTEIDSQNKVLDRLNDKAEQVDIRVANADARIQKKLR